MAHLAQVNVDVDAGLRDDGSGRSRDLADPEPARLGHLDMQAQVGHRDREDAADTTKERVAEVVCPQEKGSVFAHGVNLQKRVRVGTDRNL